jgi:hypothetical protein
VSIAVGVGAILYSWVTRFIIRSGKMCLGNRNVMELLRGQRAGGGGSLHPVHVSILHVD